MEPLQNVLGMFKIVNQFKRSENHSNSLKI